MKTKLIACAIAGAFLMTPLALGKGLLPLNPLVNGDFDTYVTPGMASALQPVADRCIGVGHQVLDPVYGPWGDYMFPHADGIQGELVAAAEAAKGGDAPGAADHAQAALNAAHETDLSPTTNLVGSYPGRIAANPSYPYYCDPNYNELAMLNPWEISRDRGLDWSSNDVVFTDYFGDGNQEAVFNASTDAFLYQSFASTQQAWSAAFDSFEFTLKAGDIPAGAEVAICFSLSPSFSAQPWVGVFCDAQFVFPASKMHAGPGGVIVLHPLTDGEVASCPTGANAYQPCDDFRAAYYAPGANQTNLLGQARLVQTSFWGFGNPNGHVVIDDVAYVGDKTMAETTPNLNPGV